MHLDFIIAGATRSGTTTLHDLFCRNPAIFMPSKKELNFFWRDQNYIQGLDWYQAFFEPAKDGQILGEASPSYLDFGILEDEKGAHYYDESNDSAARIKKDFPHIKLIFSLRNPVTRCYSIYSKAVWGGWEKADFETAITEEINGTRKPEETRLCYLRRGLYHKHLSHWFDLFPKEQIEIVIFEEWTKSPAATVHRLEEFIGAPKQDIKDEDVEAKNKGRSPKKNILSKIIIDILPAKNPLSRAISKRIATIEGYEPMSAKAEAMCRDFFAADIAALSKLLGRDLSVWTKPK